MLELLLLTKLWAHSTISRIVRVGRPLGVCQRVIVTTDDPELVWGGHKMSRSISLGEQYDHFQWPLAGKKLVTFLEPIRIIKVSAKAKTTPAVGNWADDDRESRDVDI